MHIAHEIAEGHRAGDLLDIGVGDALLRNEVEHEEDAGDRQHQEEEEGEAAEAPGVGDLHRLAADLDGMQVQEHIAHHHQRLVEGSVGIAMAEDGSPELALGDVAEALSSRPRFVVLTLPPQGCPRRVAARLVVWKGSTVV